MMRLTPPPPPEASPRRRSSRTAGGLATSRGRLLRALVALWFSLVLVTLLLLLHTVDPDWTAIRDEPVGSSPALPGSSPPPPGSGA